MHLKEVATHACATVAIMATQTKFTGLKLIWWLSLLVRFDGNLGEKPPQRVKNQNIQEKLKHSTVEPNELNNVHFTSRGKVVGSSGKLKNHNL